MRNGLTIWRPASIMDPFIDALERPMAFYGGAGNEWKPVFHVHDEKGTYVIEAELPGVAEKGLDVSVKNGVLTITAERTHDEKNGRKEYRAYGKISRSYVLPDETDVEKVEAVYKDGILSVSIPKTPEKTLPERKVPVARG